MAQKPPKPAGRTASPRFKTPAKPKAAQKQNAWDRPPAPTRGNAKATVIYAAVGEALSRWERLELELSGLFNAFIGIGQDSYAARRAYGAVTISSMRRDMLEAAAEAYFAEFPNPTLRTEFKRITRLVEKFASRRNDIAHGSVAPYGFYFALKEGQRDSFCLFPTLASTKATKLAKPRFLPDYAYTGAMIKAFGREFMGIVLHVGSLSWKIATRQALPQMSQQQASAPSPPADRARPPKHARPPRSSRA